MALILDRCESLPLSNLIWLASLLLTQNYFVCALSTVMDMQLGAEERGPFVRFFRVPQNSAEVATSPPHSGFHSLREVRTGQKGTLSFQCLCLNGILFFFFTIKQFKREPRSPALPAVTGPVRKQRSFVLSPLWPR